MLLSAAALSATPDRTVSLPRVFAFTTILVDKSSGAPTPHSIELVLEQNNDLHFANGTKTLRHQVNVGPTPTPVSLKANIVGTGTGVISFAVTLREGSGRDLGRCYIALTGDPIPPPR